MQDVTFSCGRRSICQLAKNQPTHHNQVNNNKVYKRNIPYKTKKNQTTEILNIHYVLSPL